jgi:4-hydroxybenzoate polyprenyltransferase
MIPGLSTSLEMPARAISDGGIPVRRGPVSIWLAQLRAEQWAKNLLLFAPLIFSLRLASPTAVGRSILAFILFCAVSSAGYLLNDIRDRKQDRLHPIKRHRPLTAGILPIRLVLGVAVALILLALAGAFGLARDFAILLAAHCALNLAYTFALKRIVLIELLAITGGFLLRVFAGAAVIGVTASGWLILCTTVLALLVGFGKRRQELLLLNENAAGHRRVLGSYARPFLDRAIFFAAAFSVTCYALYAVSDQTLERFHSRALLWTLPFVVAGISRYVFLLFEGDASGDPIEMMKRDRVTMGNLLLWILAVVAILYWR